MHHSDKPAYALSLARALAAGIQRTWNEIDGILDPNIVRLVYLHA